MEVVNTESLWNFEVGTQEGINVPIWTFVFFKQSNREHNQNLSNDTFCRLSVTSAQCIIGTDRCPDSAILLNNDDQDYSRGYGQTKEAVGVLTKDDILQPYLSLHVFRSSNNGDDIGYDIRFFDIRYQKNFESAQPIKVEFNF